MCGVNARDVGRCFSKIKKLKLHKKAGEKLAPSSSCKLSSLTLLSQPAADIGMHALSRVLIELTHLCIDVT